MLTRKVFATVRKYFGCFQLRTGAYIVSKYQIIFIVIFFTNPSFLLAVVIVIFFVIVIVILIIINFVIAIVIFITIIIRTPTCFSRSRQRSNAFLPSTNIVNCQHSKLVLSVGAARGYILILNSILKPNIIGVIIIIIIRGWKRVPF